MKHRTSHLCSKHRVNSAAPNNNNVFCSVMCCLGMAGQFSFRVSQGLQPDSDWDWSSQDSLLTCMPLGWGDTQGWGSSLHMVVSGPWHGSSWVTEYSMGATETVAHGIEVVAVNTARDTSTSSCPLRQPKRLVWLWESGGITTLLLRGVSCKAFVDYVVTWANNSPLWDG